jgi:hypothetical protein
MTWVFAPIVFLVRVLMLGFPEAWQYRYDDGFGLSPYWRARRDQIKWL